MNLKKILVLMVLVSALSLPASAEVVFLKDGSIFDGTIVSDGAKSIILRDKQKKTKTIQRSDILRILYTELKMGKIYIQKRDGKGIVAFMVDEDRESYTFRMDLYKPEEFILKRSDVLFISEKNPSGLQTDGDVGTDRVSLKWLPPYDAVKRYNIYTKKSEKDNYEKTESTGGKSITLKKLSSNTTYFIIVTSVDTTDYESPPSNEIKIKTKNIPPYKPAGIVREKKGNKQIVRWEESKDPDGIVTGYNIYKRGGKIREKIATVKKTEYAVPDDVSIYRLEITSMDDLNAESDRVQMLRPLQLVISLAPAGFMSSGKLGSSFNPGYGGLVNIGLRNFIFQNFEAGISSGYISISGKEKDNMDRWVFIPAAMYTGYHLRAGDWFSFFPYIKGGETVSLVKYTGFAGDKSKTVIDPVAAAGLALTGSSDSFTFSIGGDYGVLAESKGLKSFYEVYLSCGILIEL